MFVAWRAGGSTQLQLIGVANEIDDDRNGASGQPVAEAWLVPSFYACLVAQE